MPSRPPRRGSGDAAPGTVVLAWSRRSAPWRWHVRSGAMRPAARSVGRRLRLRAPARALPVVAAARPAARACRARSRAPVAAWLPGAPSAPTAGAPVGALRVSPVDEVGAHDACTERDRDREGGRRVDDGRRAQAEQDALRAGSARARERALQDARGDGGRQDRGEAGQLALALADLRLERPAVHARAQVRADRAAARRAAVAVGDPAADRLAARLAALCELVQRAPRVVDRLLGAGRRALERGGDLRVAQARHLAHHERRALALGQRADVVEQRRQALADRRAALDVEHRGAQVLRRRLGARPAQQRDRLVVRDPVEPRPQLDLALVALECPQRAQHRALQRVGRVVSVAQDRHAVAVELVVVAIEDRGERRAVALRGQPGQPRVARHAH